MNHHQLNLSQGKSFKPISRIALTSIVALMIGATPAKAADKAVYLDIPAQSLSAALVDFSRETKIAILTSDTGIPLKSIRSGKLQGSYSPIEAIQLLLSESDIPFEFKDKNTLIIGSRTFADSFRGNGFQAIAFASDAEYENNLGVYVEDESAGEAGNAQLDEIVVTGTTSKSRTKLDSSVAITTADAETLSREFALGTADALELIPGFWVEDSGGEISNNVAPRGLGGGSAFRFISVHEDGLPVIYDGDQVDSLMRQDITIERLEAIRGGTAGVLTVNGAASIVNFITRKGTEEAAGKVRLSLSDYGTYRGDFFYGAPIGGDWLLGVGGYYRTSDGARDVGFRSDEGGQFRVNLTKKLEQGEFNLNFKQIDERNTFFLPVPLQNPNDPESIPGFNANTGTMLGPDNARIRHLTPDGSVGDTNLRDGFHTKATVIGASFDWEFNDNLSLSSKGRFTQFDLAINGVFNFDNNSLVLGRDRLAAQDVTDLINQFASEGAGGAVGAELRYASSGDSITNVDSLNGNGLVADSVALKRQRNIHQFINDTRLNYVTENNSLSVGVLFASYAVEKDTTSAATFLSEVKSNPNRLDIVAVDAAGNAVGQLTDNGIVQYGSWFGNNSGNLTSYSLYANDEFQVTEDLRIDGGIRYESVSYDVVEEINGGQTNLPGNADDNIVANDFVANFGSGNFRNESKTFNEFAWTIGLSYTVTDNIAVYARYADAFQTPGLASIGAINDGSSGLTFGEIGGRYFGENFSVSLTAYRTEFKDLRFGAQPRGSSEIETINISTKAIGLEWEMSWQPVDMLSISTMGVIQDTEFDGIPEGDVNESFNNNDVTRTPQVQFRVMPTLHTDYGDLFVTFHYLGGRFADIGNTVRLPSYSTIDVGAVIDLTDTVALQIKGTNLTNAVGLTEGNPRSGFSEQPATNFFYARPIVGRTFKASVTYSF